MRFGAIALLLAGWLQGHAQATPSARLDLAVGAIAFARTHALPNLGVAKKDSVIVELGYGVDSDSLTLAVRDSLSRLVNARVVALQFANCSAGSKPEDQSRRADCATRSARFYMEVSGMVVSGDSARVALSVFQYTVTRRPTHDPFRAIAQGIGSILGKSSRVSTMTMESRTVELVREGNGWRAIRLASHA